MAVYKRGGTYWYEFQFNGGRIRETAQTRNKETARQIEAAERVRLAKGDAGIMERPPASTLKDFAPRFEKAIETLCVAHPETVGFYREKLRRLLEDSELPGLRLDKIAEAEIDAYKVRRTRQASRYGRPLSVASVNRELATLRRLLRLAQEWKVLDRVPRIRLLRGEKNREFVLSHKAEPAYLEACPQPLKDVALVMLDTGVRSGEVASLTWPHVHLQPAVRAKFGYLSIREGGTKKRQRNLSLTPRLAAMLRERKTASRSDWVFPGDTDDAPILGTSLDHQHAEVRDTLKLSKEFVVHSLRHTMLTRLGEAGADAFTIMKIAGHASVTTSQKYVHPTPEGMERAFERLQDLNSTKFAEVEAKVAAAAAGAEADMVPTKFPTVKKGRSQKPS